MPDPSIAPFLRDIWDWVRWVVGGVLALLGWKIRRQDADIERLKAHVVPRDEINSALNQIRETLDRNHERVVASMDKGLGDIRDHLREDLRDMHGRIDSIIQNKHNGSGH